MKKRKYPVRDITKVGLPEDTWLYDHPDPWRAKPDFHPPKCTWCQVEFSVLGRRWRFCPDCDAPEKKV